MVTQVIFCHGWGASADRYDTFLKHIDAPVHQYFLRGHPGSENKKFMPYDCIEDVCAITQRYEKTALIGHSGGAAIVLAAAAKRNIRSVVLNPYLGYQFLRPKHYRRVRVYTTPGIKHFMDGIAYILPEGKVSFCKKPATALTHLKKFNPLESQIRAPLLYLQSGRDGVFGTSDHKRRLLLQRAITDRADNLTDSSHLVENRDHSFNIRHTETFCQEPSNALIEAINLFINK